MTTKLLEIRDRGTCVPAMAIQVSSTDGPIMRRAGYGDCGSILLIMLVHPKVQYDPFAWDNRRTMGNAHHWIEQNWDDVKDGQVVDVRVILGETATPAPAECV